MTATTIYLGRTAGTDDAKGLHVWAEVELRAGSDLCTDRDPNQLHQTTSHEQVREGDLVNVSVTFIMATRKASSVEMLNSDRFDRYVVCGGQVSAEERVIAERSADLTADDLALIERMWAEDHLNTMNAACDHTDREPSAEELAAADFPVQYGRPDITKWKLRNLVCPETGYRWGSAWLVKCLPAERVTEYRELIARHTI